MSRAFLSSKLIDNGEFLVNWTYVDIGQPPSDWLYAVSLKIPLDNPYLKIGDLTDYLVKDALVVEKIFVPLLFKEETAVADIIFLYFLLI